MYVVVYQNEVRWLIWALKSIIMFLKNLELKNFRNISNLNLEFNNNINIFIGNNAQGKTNILECIYFLAITKSHRTRNELNLINKDQLYSKVSCVYNNDENDLHYLSILLNDKGKKVSVDNIVQPKISNYLSRLNVIMFCPDDLELIKGSPSVRRKFLNIELSQLNKKYVYNLKEYNKILKQRNEYLKQKNNEKFDKNYFDILTDSLIDKNIEIIKSRYDFIDTLNQYLGDIFKRIANMGDLTLKYKSFITKIELENFNIKNLLKNKYDLVFTNELLQKTTLIGCHKDDFNMYLDDNNILEFCSQGQQRLSVLSLKLAEIEVFIKYKKTNPIILLDDIFSELDEFKKCNIINYFSNNIQIFITTTDLNYINDDLKNKSDIFIVDNGNIRKE